MGTPHDYLCLKRYSSLNENTHIGGRDRQKKPKKKENNIFQIHMSTELTQDSR